VRHHRAGDAFWGHSSWAGREVWRRTKRPGSAWAAAREAVRVVGTACAGALDGTPEGLDDLTGADSTARHGAAGASQPRRRYSEPGGPVAGNGGQHHLEGGTMDRYEFLKTPAGLASAHAPFVFLVCPSERRRARLPPRISGWRCPVSTGEDGRVHGQGHAGRRCAGILEKTGRSARSWASSRRASRATRRATSPRPRRTGHRIHVGKQKGVVTSLCPKAIAAARWSTSGGRPRPGANCSSDTEGAFETVFGRPVQATLKESKLSGSKRCVFEVTLS